MNAILRKSLTCLLANNASSPISCSVSVRLFSTSRKGESVTSSTIYDLLLHKHQFSPGVASKVASVLNRVKDPENSDSILLFLKENGFSNAQLERMANGWPGLLSASLKDAIKPKIRVFQDFGFSSDDIAQILSINSVIMYRNFNARVIPSLSMLKKLLGTNEAVAKLLKKSGWYLLGDLEGRMVPNIEFLRSCGTPMERIIRLLYISPRCLLMKPEIIRKAVKKAEEMGTNGSSNMFIYAIRTLYWHTDKEWEFKLQALRDCGFSENHTREMFVKAPTVFSGSIEKLKRVKDYLVATGKYDISCIVHNPVSLGCSIENRYKPRFQILGILESKNLIENWPSLNCVFTKSDENFFERFVRPYLSEVDELYIAKSSAWFKKENILKALG